MVKFSISQNVAQAIALYDLTWGDGQITVGGTKARADVTCSLEAAKDIEKELRARAWGQYEQSPAANRACGKAREVVRAAINQVEG